MEFPKTEALRRYYSARAGQTAAYVRSLRSTRTTYKGKVSVTLVKSSGKQGRKEGKTGKSLIG